MPGVARHGRAGLTRSRSTPAPCGFARRRSRAALDFPSRRLLLTQPPFRRAKQSADQVSSIDAIL